MKRHATFLGAALLSFVSVLSYAQAPVPFVSLPLVPDATPPGGAQFTLTVNGTGFVSSSVVQWNGVALVTQFISGSQLTATVPAQDIAKETTASVTVATPAPGGGASNVAFFSVTPNTGNYVGFNVAWDVWGLYSAPWPLAVGDFNGDGKLDMVVPQYNYGNSMLSILLGDGTGHFTLAPLPTVVANPVSVVAGDFNGDGKLDFAVVGGGQPGYVSILVGDGTGHFALASSATVGGDPEGVATGDFNGDGKLDLAVANRNSNNVSILLGDGTGNFALASSPSAGNIPTSAAVGDFNGDGKLDLAVPNEASHDVSILLGDGNGNFTLASSPPYGGSSVAVGDFNGDSKLDLALASCGNQDCVLLGDGTGNFALASSPSNGNWSFSVLVGDFNGDGNLDLVTDELSGYSVSIWLGDGTGDFTLALDLYGPVSGGWPNSMAMGDFNQDGKLDLALPDPCCDNSISILLGIPHVPVVNLSPTSLTFGTQLVGTSSAPQRVILTNTGNAPLDITRVFTNSNFSQTNNCPHELPPGSTCGANVVFTPHNINAITGTITITDNASNSPQVVALTGTGTMVTLSPSILRFGQQQVGTTSPPQTVTLTNYGPIPVTIFGGHITGAYEHEFRVQDTTCQHSLAAGGSCTINIVFTPRRRSNAARLEVSDSGGASPQTVALRGIGY
jgi:hypothetical protein